jgi:hypothetical protein
MQQAYPAKSLLIAWFGGQADRMAVMRQSALLFGSVRMDSHGASRKPGRVLLGRVGEV